MCRRSLIIACFAFVALFLASCDKKPKIESRDFDSPEEVGANVKKGVAPKPDDEVAVIDTDFGKMTIELYSNIAPQMVARFKQLAREGFYNGTAFHRVNPQLGIIQGGDPLSKGDDPNKFGTGSSQLPNVPAELSDIPFERGIVGAARGQSLDSANCQFFIMTKRQPAFDNRYTVFGRVVDGITTADVIAGAPVAPGTERPADKIVIKSVTIQKK